MRRMLRWAAVAALSIWAGGVSAQSLLERPATELAVMVQARETSAVALVTAAIAAAKANAGLNAVISLDEDAALAEAHRIDATIEAGEEVGPLAGVPVIVKDNINVAGMATTGGTPGLTFVAAASAPVADALQAADAIVIGKANMHELAFGITSDNAAFGAVGNPADPARFAGGSSGGTAAAIAAGIVPAGLGTDTGGSVRIPAALTGIVGFRPSTWRMSQEGVVPISPTRDVVGPMARTVSDVVLFNEVMGGGRVRGPTGLTGVRLGLAHPHADDLSPDTAAVWEAALERLRAQGAEIVDVDMADIVARAGKAGFPIALYEVKQALSDFLATYQPDTDLAALVGQLASPDVKGIFETAVLGPEAVPDAVYDEAVGAIDVLREDYVALLNAHRLDAVIYPTTPLPAQPFAASQTVELNGNSLPTFLAFIRNTDPSSIYGAPGLSIPMGRTEAGLPVGLELDGRPDGDIDLLTVGLAVEAALGAR